MSFQDSHCSPIPMMNAVDFDTFDDDGDEMRGGIELGELLDIEFDFDDPIETGVSTAVGGEALAEAAAAEDDTQVQGTQSTKTRATKSIVHDEMEKITLPDGTKKWKCKWCGHQYNVDKK